MMLLKAKTKVTQTTIPFEIHLTTKILSISQQETFKLFCLENAKPLMIELSQGDFVHQPMLSKVVYSNNINNILEISTDLSKTLTNKNIPIVRLKIEVQAKDADLFINYNTVFNKYFEWHGKIELKELNKLYLLCEKNKVHLSINSLKHEPNLRFITLREFGAEHAFQSRLNNLLNDLKIGGWNLIKQESEFCIYDNNGFLDNGWLPL